MRTFLFICILLGSARLLAQEEAMASDPGHVVFHTEDIDRFWKIIDNRDGKVSSSVLQNEYLNPGSKGLKNFIPMRIESSKKLARTFQKETEYYYAVRASTLSIKDRTHDFQQSFQRLKEIYPAAKFPDVYFVIGRKNTGGTIFKRGLIIGAEMYGEPKEGFIPRLDIDDLGKTVAHEAIHFQQNYSNDKSLLAQCVKEGAADFLGELICGGHTNRETYLFGDEHEMELWIEFFERKNDNDWTGWLYYQKDKSRPKDLGYWMGYKIVKSYYERAEDRTKAISEILNIQDFQEFLAKSGYQGI